MKRNLMSALRILLSVPISFKRNKLCIQYNRHSHQRGCLGEVGEEGELGELSLVFFIARYSVSIVSPLSLVTMYVS